MEDSKILSLKVTTIQPLNLPLGLANLTLLVQTNVVVSLSLSRQARHEDKRLYIHKFKQKYE